MDYMQEKNYRLTIYDWRTSQKNDGASVKTIYFTSFQKAKKIAENMDLKWFQDVVVFDNKTDDELYFRNVEH